MQIPRYVHFLSKHSILMAQVVTYRQRRCPLRLQDRSTRLTERMRREHQLRIAKSRTVLPKMLLKQIPLTNIARRQGKHEIMRVRQTIRLLPCLPCRQQFNSGLGDMDTTLRRRRLHPGHHAHTLTLHTLRLPLHTNLTRIKNPHNPIAVHTPHSHATQHQP